MTAVTFWKNGSITSHVLWEINSVCVDTQLKSIRLTCIISGTEDDLCKFILRATKTWVVACERGWWLHVYTELSVALNYHHYSNRTVENQIWVSLD